jgi:hypothetical protein
MARFLHTAIKPAFGELSILLSSGIIRIEKGAQAGTAGCADFEDRTPFGMGQTNINVFALAEFRSSNRNGGNDLSCRDFLQRESKVDIHG